MAVIAGLEPGTAHAADVVPAVPVQNPSPAVNDYHSFSGFGSRLVDDTTATLLAPLRWDSHDWLVTGVTTVGIVSVGLLWDEEIGRDSQKDRESGKDQTLDKIGLLGTGVSLGVIGGLWIGGKLTDSPRAVDTAMDCIESSVIASGIITPSIKFIVGRERPGNGDAFKFDPFTSFSSSFPSGHTTQAFAVASVIAANYDDHPWIGATALTIAGVVGYSRINANQHYASDVLAGAAIGTAVGWSIVRRHRQQVTRLTPDVGLVLGGTVQGIIMNWRF